MSSQSVGAGAAAPAPSVPVALLIVAATVVVCAAFIALNLVAGTQEYYAGFFFLLYWAGLQKADLRVFPASAVGSFVGLALGYLLHQLQAQFGVTGQLLFVASLLVVLFVYTRQQLRLAINDATMVFLTLSTVMHVQAHASFPGMFVSFVLSVVFFGALFWGMARLSARNVAPAASQKA